MTYHVITQTILRAEAAASLAGLSSAVAWRGVAWETHKMGESCLAIIWSRGRIRDIREAYGSTLA